jgi:hypothetical protein
MMTLLNLAQDTLNHRSRLRGPPCASLRLCLDHRVHNRDKVRVALNHPERPRPLFGHELIALILPPRMEKLVSESRLHGKLITIL